MKTSKEASIEIGNLTATKPRCFTFLQDSQKILENKTKQLDMLKWNIALNHTLASRQ